MTGDNIKFSKLNSGYTIIEMMVTVSIFALAFVAVSAIFLGFSTAQSRASSSQRLLNEGNHMFETIAREVRMHAIDYDCPTADYEYDTDYICLRSLSNTESIHFWVRDVSGIKTIQVCRELAANPCQEASDWAPLTAGFIQINDFDFRVFPYVDPAISFDQDLISQPMVHMTMTMQAGTGQAVQIYDFQTAVSSRAYTF